MRRPPDPFPGIPDMVEDPDGWEESWQSWIDGRYPGPPARPQSVSEVMSPIEDIGRAHGGMSEEAIDLRIQRQKVRSLRLLYPRYGLTPSPFAGHPSPLLSSKTNCAM